MSAFPENSRIEVSKEVVARKNHDGTVILMKTDESSLFFKIDGIAASVWKELETPKPFNELVEHFCRLHPKHQEKIRNDIPAFLGELQKRGLIHTN